MSEKILHNHDNTEGFHCTWWMLCFHFELRNAFHIMNHFLILLNATFLCFSSVMIQTFKTPCTWSHSLPWKRNLWIIEDHTIQYEIGEDRIHSLWSKKCLSYPHSKHSAICNTACEKNRRQDISEGMANRKWCIFVYTSFHLEFSNQWRLSNNPCLSILVFWGREKKISLVKHGAASAIASFYLHSW